MTLSFSLSDPRRDFVEGQRVIFRGSPRWRIVHIEGDQIFLEHPGGAEECVRRSDLSPIS